MDGPERLEDDARPARRWTWVVVAVVVAAVAGLGAVRLANPGPGPAPAPGPSPTPGATSAAWPRGVGTGTVYVLDGRGVATIDLGSGLVQRSGLDVDPTTVTLTPGRYGVLVWPQNGVGTAHQVAPGVEPPGTVTGVLAQGRQFLPGPGLSVWVTPEPPGGHADHSTWRLVDETGAVQAAVRLGGFVVADGAGGLFDLGDTRVRHVVPGQPTTSWEGSVTAVGPDGWEALLCHRQRCTDVLHDRSTGREVTLDSPTPSDLGDAALAPGNTMVAAAVQHPDGNDDAVLVRVSVLGRRDEVATFPASDAGASFAWVSDRWLVGTGQQGLVLVDTVDGRVVEPDVGVVRPRQVVYRPA